MTKERQTVEEIKKSIKDVNAKWRYAGTITGIEDPAVDVSKLHNIEREILKMAKSLTISPEIKNELKGPVKDFIGWADNEIICEEMAKMFDLPLTISFL